jgi:Family of unknown function (DUF5309)
MAVQVGRRGTYDSTVGTRYDIEDLVNMISPFDVPFLGTYGTDRGSILGSEDTMQTKVEWLEDELVPGSDALAATAVTAATYITVDNQSYFKTNDLIRIDDEYLRVSDYGATASTLLVERSWGAPAADQHEDAATVLILGTLPVEGDDPVSGVNFNRTQPYNITQIYQDEVEVTRTEEKKGKYGVQSEAAYQIAKRGKEGAIKLERNIILGTRADDTTNKRRSMGGLDYYITTNVDSSSTLITETLLLDQMQDVFDAGGNTDILAVGGTQKRRISAWDSDDIRLARDDNIRGAVVDYFDSDFGRAYVVLNRWVPLRFAFGLERQYISMVWFDRMFTEALAKTGDRQQWQVIHEVSMKVKNEKAHFKFTALT